VPTIKKKQHTLTLNGHFFLVFSVFGVLSQGGQMDDWEEGSSEKMSRVLPFPVLDI